MNQIKKKIKEVEAIIENENKEILCALRSSQMTLPNMWEFPGGKVEGGESLHDAIEREIKEELDCTIEAIGIFNDNTHEYEKFIINLICIKCKLVQGTPIACEHSKLIWLKRDNLDSLKWAPSDIPTIYDLINE